MTSNDEFKWFLIFLFSAFPILTQFSPQNNTGFLFYFLAIQPSSSLVWKIEKLLVEKMEKERVRLRGNSFGEE